MILKFQAPIPGEQPSVGASNTAVMQLPNGPRVGVVYIEATVIKAAGGAGVTSLPLVTDIINSAVPCVIKIGGKPERTRLIEEHLGDNLLQDSRAAGSVTYFQAGAQVGATVLNCNNSTAPTGGNALATNTATTAVFQIPFYFAEYWRRDLATAEGMAWATAFSDGSFLPALTVEAPTANNAGAVFSGHNIRMWYDFDGAVWPGKNGVSSTQICKKDRFTKQYAATGDMSFDFTTIMARGDALMQFSILLAAGDTFSKILIKKNGTVIRDVTKARNDQTLFDHDMNAQSGLLPNRFDIVFDVNDIPSSALPLKQTDTFEVTVTLASVAGAATAVLLTETLGNPS